MRLTVKPADLSEWERVVEAATHQSGEVHIVMVGKYVGLTDSYKSLSEALNHTGLHTGKKICIDYCDSEELNAENVASILGKYDGIIVPGGFGKRGIEGKILAIQFARENNIPYLGICLGMQTAVIEYARHKANMPGANSTEFDANTSYPVVALVTEWQEEDGTITNRDANSDKGGTMRLGSQPCQLAEGSVVRKLYNKSVINERHRHRYEVNSQFMEPLVAAGLRVSGRSLDNRLVEMVEIPGHRWFVGCQFHPEFTSTPRDGHPLFNGFIEAAINYQQERKSS